MKRPAPKSGLRRRIDDPSPRSTRRKCDPPHRTRVGGGGFSISLLQARCLRILLQGRPGPWSCLAILAQRLAAPVANAGTECCILRKLQGVHVS